MTKVALTEGAYTARSLIASAQRAVNIYPEKNPPDSPFPFTHYPRGGLVQLSGSLSAQARGQYRASNGMLFEVVGSMLYVTSSSWVRTPLGTISSSSGPVSMIDNGLVLILVDGSSSGWCVDLATNLFAAISGAGAFYGADTVAVADTFLLFNRPGTQQWYISLSEVNFLNLTGGPLLTGSITPGSAYTNGTYAGVALTNLSSDGDGATADITVAGGLVTVVTIDTGGENYQPGDTLTALPASIGGTGSGFVYTVLTAGSSAFDPLDIAAKVGEPDLLVGLIANRREIWLIGEKTTEVWYNAGAADFPYQIIPGVFIEHGCVAVASISRADVNTFWLSSDEQGQSIVFKGANYQAERISTHAIENEFLTYSTVSDAVGFCYQQEGHTFYFLTFPTADKTWVYDLATGLWHEQTWTDTNGIEHRHRANCGAFAYGTNVIGDWETGALYQVNLNSYTDFGGPIVRRRGFPHIIDERRRQSYRQFIAEMETGSIPGTLSSNPPYLSLRWSDTKGYDWSKPLQLSLGSTGQRLLEIRQWQLGISRDRVFEIYWDGAFETALSGAYVDVVAAGT